jgi:hypothetical protein
VVLGVPHNLGLNPCPLLIPGSLASWGTSPQPVSFHLGLGRTQCLPHPVAKLLAQPCLGSTFKKPEGFLGCRLYLKGALNGLRAWPLPRPHHFSVCWAFLKEPHRLPSQQYSGPLCPHLATTTMLTLGGHLLPTCWLTGCGALESRVPICSIQTPIPSPKPGPGTPWR